MNLSFATFIYVILVQIDSLNSLVCRSNTHNILSDNELNECWKKFCTCPKTCSEVSNNIEDTFMLLYIRLKAVLCGDLYEFDNKGTPIDIKYIVKPLETQVLVRIDFDELQLKSYETYQALPRGFTDTRGLAFTFLTNLFGHKFDTVALFQGKIVHMGGELKMAPDKETWIRTFYSFKYAAIEDTAAGKQNPPLYENLILGPIGEQLTQRVNLWFLIPDYFNNQINYNISGTLTAVQLDSDYTIRPAFMGKNRLLGSYMVCFGKTLGSNGETHWTGKGCRPYVSYKKFDPGFENGNYEIKCECDFDLINEEQRLKVPKGGSTDGTLLAQVEDGEPDHTNVLLGSILLIIVLLFVLTFTLIILQLIPDMVKFENSIHK